MNSSESTTTSGAKRYEYLDFSRGIIMALMALDHSSFFWNCCRFTDEGLRGNFTQYANIAQLITRVITHFAPTTFIWLSGFMVATSALKRLNRRDTENTVSWHFTLRGIILIVLHLTILNLGFEIAGYLNGNLKEIFLLQVLWTIGINMIILAWLRRLGITFLTIVTLLIFFIFPFFSSQLSLFTNSNPVLYALGIVTFAPTLNPDAPLFCIYPIIPWNGVMIFGYLCGIVFHRYSQMLSNERLVRIYALTGISLFIVFLILRYANGYGNYLVWKELTFQQFVTISKYPPSLVYLFFTFGQMFILFAVSLKLELCGMYQKFPFQAIMVYGRVPLFFYCTHILFYGPFPVLFGIQNQYNLSTVYLVWILGMALMYKPCKWYFQYKMTHPQSLARYI